MNSSTLTDLVLGLVVIGYLGSRQLTWRPIDPARRFRLPLIAGAAGVVLMVRQHPVIHPVDGAILGLSAVFALVSGGLMGRITRFRPSPADPRITESRAGWLGAGIWFALVVVRVGLDLAGHRMGADLAVSTGSIVLVLALNRLASALVVSARQPRQSLAMARK